MAGQELDKQKAQLSVLGPIVRVKKPISDEARAELLMSGIMRESFKRRLAAVEALASPKMDIDKMSLEELEASVDNQAK